MYIYAISNKIFQRYNVDGKTNMMLSSPLQHLPLLIHRKRAIIGSQNISVFNFQINYMRMFRCK